MTASRVLTSPRAATSERWQRAAERAIKRGVTVRQLAGSGAWIATSATDTGKAYELEIQDGIVQSCSCEAAALWGDPICCHRARFYLDTGRIVLAGVDAGDGVEDAPL